MTGVVVAGVREDLTERLTADLRAAFGDCRLIEPEGGLVAPEGEEAPGGPPEGGGQTGSGG